MSETVENEANVEILYKSFAFELINIEQETKGTQQIGVFEGAMATEDKDRGNDIIAPEAFDNTLKRYKKQKRNIKVFYNHNTSNVPVGIIPIKTVSKDGKKWLIKGELNLDTQLGREVYSSMKQGALTDLSIGFSIIEQDFKNNMRIIKDLELWEVSIVSEPMNPKAVINEVKGASIFKELPLADKGVAWDSSKAMDRVKELTDSEDNPSKLYRNAFFWFDEKNSDSFGSYKLPFADVVDGKLTAIPKAIFAAAAAMRGARGGVNIPDEDKARVTSHINKYYDKMDLESPLKNKNIEYALTFDNELKKFYKFDIDNVENIKTREEFNELLSKSGVFSRAACEFLASCFVSKQSKSEKNKSGEAYNMLLELKAVLKNL